SPWSSFFSLISELWLRPVWRAMAERFGSGLGPSWYNALGSWSASNVQAERRNLYVGRFARPVVGICFPFGCSATSTSKRSLRIRSLECEGITFECEGNAVAGHGL